MRDYLKWLDTLEISPEEFESVPENLRKSRKFIFAAFGRNPLLLRYIPKNIAMQFLCNYPEHFNNAPEEIRGDIQIATAVIKYSPFEFAHVPIDVALLMLKQNGNLISYASQSLKEDPEALFNALNTNQFAVREAGPNLKNNKQFMLAVISRDVSNANLLSIELEQDKEFILELIRLHPEVIAWLSNNLEDLVKENIPLIKTWVSKEQLYLITPYLSIEDLNDSCLRSPEPTTFVNNAVDLPEPSILPSSNNSLTSSPSSLPEASDNNGEELFKLYDGFILSPSALIKFIGLVDSKVIAKRLIDDLCKTIAIAEAELINYPEFQNTARIMFHSIFSEIDSLLTKDSKEAQTKIIAAIDKARPSLEKLPWWKEFLNGFWAFIVNLAKFQPHKSGKQFLLFKNPNPYKELLDTIHESIEFLNSIPNEYNHTI